MRKVKEARSHRRKWRTTESSGQMIVFRWTCVVIPLVATLVAGCNNTRHSLKRSDFYQACAEWASSDDAFSFESGPVFDGKLVGNSGGGSADQLHFTLEVKTSIHGPSDGAAQIIKELGTDLQKLAKNVGARTEVKHSSEKWFEFRYVAGDAHGTVLIQLDDKELIVTVDERIP